MTQLVLTLVLGALLAWPTAALADDSDTRPIGPLARIAQSALDHLAVLDAELEESPHVIDSHEWQDAVAVQFSRLLVVVGAEGRDEAADILYLDVFQYASGVLGHSPDLLDRGRLGMQRLRDHFGLPPASGPAGLDYPELTRPVRETSV